MAVAPHVYLNFLFPVPCSGHQQVNLRPRTSLALLIAGSFFRFHLWMFGFACLLILRGDHGNLTSQALYQANEPQNALFAKYRALLATQYQPQQACGLSTPTMDPQIQKLSTQTHQCMPRASRVPQALPWKQRNQRNSTSFKFNLSNPPLSLHLHLRTTARRSVFLAVMWCVAGARPTALPQALILKVLFPAYSRKILPKNTSRPAPLIKIYIQPLPFRVRASTAPTRPFYGTSFHRTCNKACGSACAMQRAIARPCGRL